MGSVPLGKNGPLVNDLAMQLASIEKSKYLHRYNGNNWWFLAQQLAFQISLQRRLKTSCIPQASSHTVGHIIFADNSVKENVMSDRSFAAKKHILTYCTNYGYGPVSFGITLYFSSLDASSNWILLSHGTLCMRTRPDAFSHRSATLKTRRRFKELMLLPTAISSAWLTESRCLTFYRKTSFQYALLQETRHHGCFCSTWLFNTPFIVHCPWKNFPERPVSHFNHLKPRPSAANTAPAGQTTSCNTSFWPKSANVWAICNKYCSYYGVRSCLTKQCSDMFWPSETHKMCIAPTTDMVPR